MSHEIRTPLNGVIAVADVLAGTELTHSQKEMVGLIRSSGETLSCILADVLDLARIESGKLTLEQHPFNLAEAVRQVAFLLELRAQEKGVELLVEIAPEAETLVMGDVVRVKQVATNLLSNAVKFTERGSVKISVARTVEGFRLTVRDTGVGFDPSVTQDLFKPFQQADGSITRRFGGTGLGLAICRELVDAMGGELDCSGSPGEGAEFTVLLPLIVAAPLIENGSEAAPATEPAATQRALRVLLADDHPTNRKVVELIMAQCGAEVTSVEEGLQAVSAFRQAEFDVVLMDMQMPVCDGLSATRAIRDHERSSAALPCPVIMLTANALPEHIRASVAAGANAHLSKPYTASQLLACIDSVLQNSAAEPDTPERSPVMTMRD
jgi:CheY-like chemotaxis protein